MAQSSKESHRQGKHEALRGFGSSAEEKFSAALKEVGRGCELRLNQQLLRMQSVREKREKKPPKCLCRTLAISSICENGTEAQSPAGNQMLKPVP